MIKKLPDAEFEIMKAVWDSEEPVTSSVLTEKLRHTLSEKDWKPQTVLTMLVRLEKKGYLRSEKLAKERSYYTRVTREDYLNIEAESLKSRFDSASLNGIVKALCSSKIDHDDLNELKKWLEEK